MHILIHALQEVRQAHLQKNCHSPESADLDIYAPALKQTNMGPVQSAGIRKPLLGKTLADPNLAHS